MAYDWTSEYFAPHGYGATWYGPAEDCQPPASYGQQGWCDEDDASGGGWFFPSAEALGAWESAGVFVPPPRVAAEESTLTSVGVAAALPSRPRRRPRPPGAVRAQLIGPLFGAMTAATFAAVCLLGWALSYDPLQGLAISRVPRDLSGLWPAIVIGPWLVGCLSVLRAALDGRRAVHSWVVVILFAGVATWLCAAGVSRTMPDLVVAGLPPITAVVSLQQLTRQLIAGRRLCRTPSGQAARRASHKASRKVRG
ncbi:DUF2637 domain-containing protein [Kitasatospora aureofaciens]|uniref:DUF2637 domain-containing protein n=1 Tax=Kitasatospora aureofaciens TaxID=1894 RepID=UPI001C47FFD5|nr:DUF2637 domain-containing protein [Kitasatospora aureofaciens]MBV6697860.1 DUF2637 domain-containing protein [Kitasatospora aureofaciens]